jgi:hypothetical protein
MSYESTNNNTRTQQMMMRNSMISSNYYNESPSQSPMTNQYQPYHQTVSF